MIQKVNFLLVGVGGQGTILASDVLVNVGLAAGLQAKQAEVHGMSQRGGSVTSHVRWGDVVYSPLVGAGEVDVMLAFEKAEALRNLYQLRNQSIVVMNQQAIEPVTVTSGGQIYPDDAWIHTKFAEITKKLIKIDGGRMAEELGNIRVANVILIGALSAVVEKEGLGNKNLTPELWLEVLVQRVPQKYIDLNKRAFEMGRQTAIVSLEGFS